MDLKKNKIQKYVQNVQFFTANNTNLAIPQAVFVTWSSDHPSAEFRCPPRWSSGPRPYDPRVCVGQAVKVWVDLESKGIKNVLIRKFPLAPQSLLKWLQSPRVSEQHHRMTTCKGIFSSQSHHCWVVWKCNESYYWYCKWPELPAAC